MTIWSHCYESHWCSLKAPPARHSEKKKVSPQVLSDTCSEGTPGPGAAVGMWARGCEHMHAERDSRGLEWEEVCAGGDLLKGSNFSPPGSVGLGAARGASLLRAGGGRHGQRRGDGGGRSHGGGGRAGGEHGEGAGEGQREALRCSRGRCCRGVNGGRQGQEGGGERRDAGSDAAGGGDSEGGIGVGEGGGEQSGAVRGHVRGESARGGVRGVESVRLQQGGRQVVEGGCPVVRVQGVVVVGHGRGHGSSFPLRGTGAQVRHESDAQRVGCVETFHRSQVPRHFCQALPEADAHEIHGQGMSVKITCKGRAKYVLNVELANLVLAQHHISRLPFMG